MYCVAFAALPNAVSAAIIQEAEEAEEEEDEEKEHRIKEISREHLNS